MITVLLIKETTPADAESDDMESDTDQLDVGFRELVRLLQDGGFHEPSSWPATGSRHEWVNSEPWQDPWTGDWERTSIHFDASNPFRRAKYWKKAMQAAGII